ncbi:MAG: hydrolase, partial [Brachybacterium sp.]|nr:hydrolase [Brachybacterium sp.]
MSKTVNNTHRRAMRTVTPAVRAGRATAGAAMAAAMLFGGAAAATAEPSDPQAEGPAAPQADAPS